jgi:GTP cyclohydrolase I
MNAPDCFFLPDIQARADLRQLAIHKVGVKGLRYPLALLDAAGKVQHTVAELSMAVGLPPRSQGDAHVALRRNPRTAARAARRSRPAGDLFDDMLLRLDAQSGEIELAFPYFIRKAAPVSGVESLLDYDVRMIVGQRPGRTASSSRSRSSLR